EGAPQRLVIVGDGPLRGALEDTAEAAQVTDLVEFAGELTAEEVRARLASADLFCLPSFSEGLPVSIMEAMAVGVPVVTTWIAGIPELAESGVTALPVSPATRSCGYGCPRRRGAESNSSMIKLAAGPW